MVMDHVERCIDGTLIMLVQALSKHAWSWIYNRGSSTCTLGILSLSEAPNQYDVVQKALNKELDEIVWVGLEVQRIAWTPINSHSHPSDESV